MKVFVCNPLRVGSPGRGGDVSTQRLCLPARLSRRDHVWEALPVPRFQGFAGPKTTKRSGGASLLLTGPGCEGVCRNGRRVSLTEALPLLCLPLLDHSILWWLHGNPSAPLPVLPRTFVPRRLSLSPGLPNDIV